MKKRTNYLASRKFWCYAIPMAPALAIFSFMVFIPLLLCLMTTSWSPIQDMYNSSPLYFGIELILPLVAYIIGKFFDVVTSVAANSKYQNWYLRFIGIALLFTGYKWLLSIAIGLIVFSFIKQGNEEAVKPRVKQRKRNKQKAKVKNKDYVAPSASFEPTPYRMMGMYENDMDEML